MDLPGGRVRPDIVFPAIRLAVFIDGCFWHGCPEHGEYPRANGDFWRTKIEATRGRDRRHDSWLRDAEWEVLRIWEHEPDDIAVDRISAAVAHLRSSSGSRTALRTPSD